MSVNQSGAINESFSDIWGEFVDQTNGQGNDSDWVRWQIGEDTRDGAFRDMKNPPNYSHPDRITSFLYYCGSNDAGEEILEYVRLGGIKVYPALTGVTVPLHPS